ncbi:MAG TPA: hypothetical protein PKV41_04825 [Candidatus Omnitrophota bacterium]|nr:hypothetical protein [Candidatus Omnitrophota bacterium]
MQRICRNLLIVPFLLAALCPSPTRAERLDNNKVINHDLAHRIELLQEKGGYSSEDFNACQITWSIRKLEKTDPASRFQPHEITFQYENREIIKMVNTQDGDTESIRRLGLNCLEFNSYVYLFFDTLSLETSLKFNLPDPAYVIYSPDKGNSWSELKSLRPVSAKTKFVLPHNKFRQYARIFGNSNNHALSIFNLQDETTYLFDPKFNLLKTVPVYHRLSSFDSPTDFYWHNNTLYLVRGSCEMIKGQLQCPPRTYMETSKDFGQTWEKTKLPFTPKSYFLKINNSLYRFYFSSCPSSWLGLVPAMNRSNYCGYIKAEKLEDNGTWGKPKVLIQTVDRLFGVYADTKPILVWQDLRFHKSRACGYIPVVGCLDATPFRGPTVIYAGELDPSNWQINESIITYKN